MLEGVSGAMLLLDIQEERPASASEINTWDGNAAAEKARVFASSGAEAEVDTAAPPRSAAAIKDENTGLGGWVTVSSRVYDEAEEQQEELQRVRDEERRLNIRTHVHNEGSNNGAGSSNGTGAAESREVKHECSNRTSRDEDEDEDGGRGRGRGSYKEVRLSDSHTQAKLASAELSSIAGGTHVAFKKRRGAAHAATAAVASGDGEGASSASFLATSGAMSAPAPAADTAAGTHNVPAPTPAPAPAPAGAADAAKVTMSLGLPRKHGKRKFSSFLE